MKTVPFRIVLSFEALISPEEAAGKEKLAYDALQMASTMEGILADDPTPPKVRVVSVTVDGKEVPLP